MDIWFVLFAAAAGSPHLHFQRLDPAVMHVSCIQAGTLLARLGRPEVSNCIAGLEQYSYSYEEAGDQAIDIKGIYNLARVGDFDMNHMASVVPRVATSNSMMVDEPVSRNSGIQTVRLPYINDS
jgi:hypothetical protein